MKSITQQLTDFQEQIESKTKRLNQIEGEMVGLEKQMKQDHNSDPKKAETDIKKMEQQEEQLRRGLERNLEDFREKYGLLERG